MKRRAAAPNHSPTYLFFNGELSIASLLPMGPRAIEMVPGTRSIPDTTDETGYFGVSKHRRIDLEVHRLKLPQPQSLCFNFHMHCPKEKGRPQRTALQ